MTTTNTPMARISISQASKDFKVSRNTIYKALEKGRLTRDANGLVDTIDLIRLFSSQQSTGQQSTAVNKMAEQVIEQVEQREQLLLQQQVQQLQAQVQSLETQLQYVKQNEAWLKQQLDQKLLEQKKHESKGLLGRLFG
jgi:predicted RNase H-like nuclease (RuvC/YqgF family)